MFGAIYVGLSGLNAYSRGLTQVSGNVSNLNSSGFKCVECKLHRYRWFIHQRRDSRCRARPLRAEAEWNSASIQRDFAQGELRQTQRDLDLAIDGTGFLVLMRGDEIFYTRTGSFEVDKDGFIVLAGTDYRLATLDGSGRAVSLSIDASRTSIPAKTTTIKFADNLSSTATNDPTTGIAFALSDIKVFDAMGGEHKWNVQFSKDMSATAAPNSWLVKVVDDKGVVIGKVTDATGTVIDTGEKSLKFNLGVVDPTTSALVFADAASGLSVTLDFSQGVQSYSSGQVSTLRVCLKRWPGNGHNYQRYRQRRRGAGAWLFQRTEEIARSRRDRRFSRPAIA